MSPAKCLFCYQPLDAGATQEYHEKCSKKIFGSLKVPTFNYDLREINDLAKQVINLRWQFRAFNLNFLWR